MQDGDASQYQENISNHPVVFFSGSDKTWRARRASIGIRDDDEVQRQAGRRFRTCSQPPLSPRKISSSRILGINSGTEGPERGRNPVRCHA